jgi:serine/threonine protein kinase
MELITNGALDSYLKNEEIGPESPMNEEIFFRVGRGIAAGMRALAKQRVVHRDLAARNILLGDGYEPKVSDFGFSRVVTSSEGGIGKTASTVGPSAFLVHSTLLV